jgi:two-component system, OmpR family, KDP operon response regulator KdpE
MTLHIASVRGASSAAGPFVHSAFPVGHFALFCEPADSSEELQHSDVPAVAPWPVRWHASCLDRWHESQSEFIQVPDYPPLILIIEDKIPDRSLLIASLMHAGYRVSQAAAGGCGLAEFAMQKPDAVVLDLRLPDVAGTEIVRQLRERSSVPIVALACEGQPEEDAAAVDAGADVVVSRPFDVDDLLSRLRQILCGRVGNDGTTKETPFTVGDLCVDFATGRLSLGNREIPVSSSEFLLLATLIQHSGRVVTYRYLINQIWNSQQAWKVPYLKLLVSSLRHKLEPNPARPRYLIAERGVGYRMGME